MIKVLRNDDRAYYLNKLKQSLLAFAPLSQEALDMLLSKVEIICIKKNVVIQQEGEVAEYTHLLLDGVVREHVIGETFT